MLLVISDFHQQGATAGRWPLLRASQTTIKLRRSYRPDALARVEFLARLLPAGQVNRDRQMLERLRDVIADTADEFDLIVIDDGLFD